MRRLTLTIAAIAAVAITAAATVAAGTEQPPGQPEPRTPTTAPASAPPTTPPAPTWSPPPDTWASWANLDTTTGQIITGGQPGTSSTESMIKIAIAADYLHGLETAGRDPTSHELTQLTQMIRDSDDRAAEELYRARGRDAMLRRVIAGCALQHTTLTYAWWSKTQLDAADAAQLGACVTGARLTSPRWSEWITEQMRNVQGEGRFGIVQAVPDAAIKNGWTLREDGLWHVNCLAVTGGRVVVVLTRYPAGRGLGYGAELCRQVADAIL